MASTPHNDITAINPNIPALVRIRVARIMTITPVSSDSTGRFPSPAHEAFWRLREKLYVHKVDMSLAVRRKKLTMRINLRRNRLLCGAAHA
jgi:hypothetical protein